MSNSIRQVAVRINKKLILHSIVIILLVGGAASRIHSMSRSLWRDEAWVANSVLEPSIVEMIYYHPRLQTTPPLFLILVRSVISMFGVSNQTFRLVPVFFGIAALAPMAWLAFKLLRAPFALIALFLFAFCPTHVYYSHDLKQYSSDTFASLVLLSLTLIYFEGRNRRRAALYVWVPTFLVLGFLSYQAPLFLPTILLGMLATFIETHRASNSQNTQTQAGWLDFIAVGLCGALVSLVNYFLFIRPNTNPTLYLSFWSGFPHGKNPWKLLLFYINSAGTLASSVIQIDRYPLITEGAGAVIGGIALIAVGALSLRAIKGNNAALNRLLLLVLPLILTCLLNLARLYPIRSDRITLFLVPLVIILFVYGVQSICFLAGACAVRRVPGWGGIERVQDALGGVIVALLIPLFWLYTTTVSASPLFRHEPLEDAEGAIRYLSGKTQVQDVVYVHAAFREQFKFYFRIEPLLSRIVYGSIGADCCPRDVTEARKVAGAYWAYYTGSFTSGVGEADRIPEEVARLGRPENQASIWFVFLDSEHFWEILRRRDPELFERGLAARGCLQLEVKHLRDIRIDQYVCGRK